MGKKHSERRDIQSLFLNSIKDVIPPKTTLVNELSDLLEISMDSAYRRIRGETLLTIDEIDILCSKFNISFDALANIKAGMVSFAYLPLEPLAENFNLYHKSMLFEISKISSHPDSNIVYACQDLPLFHHYSFPDLANFKVFYWKRSIMNVPDMTNKKFGVNINFADLLETGKEIAKAYSVVNSMEIWTNNTIQSTLKQIRFYWDSGIFESIDDALRVCEALRNEIEQIQLYAEHGTKLIKKEMILESGQISDKTLHSDIHSNFQLYISEIEITNNCVLVNVGNEQTVYLGHFSFSTMSTRNDIYCKKTDIWLNNIVRKSTLISGVAEKQRYQFFRMIYDEIKELEDYIEK